MPARAAFAVLVALVILLKPLSAHDPITTRVTWKGEISRIVLARCVSCHRPGGRAPMSLTTWQEARPWARAIREETLTRRMPLWHAARGYGDFSNDPSLSPFEIALIAAWADGGAPLGTDADKGQGTREKGQGTGQLPEGAVERTVTCADQPFPAGMLHGVRIDAAPGSSVGIAAALPDGRREIILWVRDFDPAFAPTYWLRTPLHVLPGSRLIAETASPTPSGPIAGAGTPHERTCSVRLTMTALR